MGRAYNSTFRGTATTMECPCGQWRAIDFTTATVMRGNVGRREDLTNLVTTMEMVPELWCTCASWNPSRTAGPIGFIPGKEKGRSEGNTYGIAVLMC